MQENSMNINSYVNMREDSDSLDFSPPPVISTFRLGKKQLLVVRDDLLPGGSKQRGAIPYLRSLVAIGRTHFVYASPFSGSAQVTLGFCCARLKAFGVKCTIYCEKTPRGSFHEFAYLAESYGSDIILCESLADAHARSLDMQSNDTHVVPLGFDDPSYRKFLECEIRKHWQTISIKYDILELWLPIGSGTLLNIFKKIVSDNIKIYGVNVNVLPENDPRISTIMSDERVIYIRYKKKFHEAHAGITPVPSNIFYDAKVFSELKKTSGVDSVALWWNVAR